MNNILLFVYGTLKREYWNNVLLRDGGGEFIGEYTIDQGYRMANLGGIPALVPQDDLSVSYPIHGELFKVSAELLRRIDRLEGHPNFYERRSVTIPHIGEAFFYCLPEDRASRYFKGYYEDGRYVA